MYRHLENRLRKYVRDFLRRAAFLNLPPGAYEELNIVIEQPPRIELGDYALPLAFELIKQAKKHDTFRAHPRKHPSEIAKEVADGIGEIEGFERPERAGIGYINCQNRSRMDGRGVGS